MARKRRRTAKAETPKGFSRIFGAQVTQRTQMLRRVAEVIIVMVWNPLENSGVETVEGAGQVSARRPIANEGVFAGEEAIGWPALCLRRRRLRARGAVSQ